jgi:hypothetical protein
MQTNQTPKPNKNPYKAKQSKTNKQNNWQKLTQFENLYYQVQHKKQT